MRMSFFFLVVSSLVLAYPLVPDFNSSPGHLCTEEDDDFSEYRYDEQIVYCARDVSSASKKKIYKEYGIDQSQRRKYTIDHIIPLSIGGSNSRSNLWPEHKEVKATRPDLEYELFLDLKAGKITQRNAVKQILQVKFKDYDDVPSSVSNH